MFGWRREIIFSVIIFGIDAYLDYNAKNIYTELEGFDDNHVRDTHKQRKLNPIIATTLIHVHGRYLGPLSRSMQLMR